MQDVFFVVYLMYYIFTPGGVFHTTFEQLVGSMAMCICRIANLHRDALPDAQDESGVYSALCHEVDS